MAVAKKCDRCGKFYEYYAGRNTEFKKSGKSNGLVLLDYDTKGGYWVNKSYDLCPECMRKLEAFLIRNEEDNSNEQQFKDET